MFPLLFYLNNIQLEFGRPLIRLKIHVITAFNSFSGNLSVLKSFEHEKIYIPAVLHIRMGPEPVGVWLVRGTSAGGFHLQEPGGAG